MFNNPSKILFMGIIIISTLVAISANSWLGAWMGLEINLLSFIPLMSGNNSLMASEASIKYFLVQALASSTLLFSSILMLLESNSVFNGLLNTPNLMITSSLLMKMGAAPFYFWFPLVMEGLSWSNSLILMTWQKLAPLMLVSYLNDNNLLKISVLMSVAAGSLGGLNQLSLRKLMAYSSINHLGWMIASMSASETLWMNYFFFYSFLSASVIFMLNAFNVVLVPQLFSTLVYSLPLKFMLFLSVLSLGGLPPFSGFFPKWMTIQLLSVNGSLLELIALVSFSLVTLFFYLRMSYSAFTVGQPEANWTFFPSLSETVLLLFYSAAFFSATGLLMASMFFSLM